MAVEPIRPKIPSFYTSVPAFERTFEELTVGALWRIEVLSGIIDNHQIAGLEARNDWDIATHLSCRLAVASNPEPHFRRWLIHHEARLFRARLDRWLTSADPRAHEPDWCSQVFGMHYTPCGASGAKRVRQNKTKSVADEELQGGLQAHVEAQPEEYSSEEEGKEDETWSRVPFEEALPLLKGRQVVIVGGFAEVPSSAMPVIVTARFKSLLQTHVGGGWVRDRFRFLNFPLTIAIVLKSGAISWHSFDQS